MICCALAISIIIVILIILFAFLAPVILVLLGFVAVATITGGSDSGENKADSRSQALTSAAALALEYPYCRLYMTDKQVDTAFNNVQDYKLKLVTGVEYKIINMPELTSEQLLYRQSGVQVSASAIIELSPDDYKAMNWMSDWFNEKARLSCKRYDEDLSPLDYWAKNKQSVIDEVIRIYGKAGLTYERLHDAIYEKVMGCNNFRPGLMRGVIEMFGATSVLDPSAGWGDRLIGALAAGVRYVGVDPNPLVHEGYKAIIERFAGANLGKYTCIVAPFQDCELPVVPDSGPVLETYDMVFTSPPYFDLEIYSSDKSQSTSEFSTLDAWFEGFLLKSLAKAWAVLRDGGHMIIVINNIRGKPDFVMRMVEQVSKYPRAEYLGVISYAELRTKGKSEPFYKSPQPMWVWAKTATSGGQVTDEAHMGAQVGSIHSPISQFISIDDGPERPTEMTYEAFLRGHEGTIDMTNDDIEVIESKIMGLSDGQWVITSVAYDDKIHKTHDMIYHGQVTTGPKSSLSVWQKRTLALNPPIVIEDIKGPSDRIFKVVRDDLLPGGTKQRGIGVIKAYPEHEIVYAGPWNGYAQVALGIAGKLYNKIVTLFMTRDDYYTNLRAKMYGARFKVMPGATLKQLQASAAAYVDDINSGKIRHRTDDETDNVRSTARLMEFGFDSEAFRTELGARISEALGDYAPICKDFRRTVWIVAGSGTLLNVLYGVFPVARFGCVQVGKTIWPDQVDNARTTIYVAPESFYDEAAEMPPYSSASRYDAKLWQFVVKHGQSGDIIWNVAA